MGISYYICIMNAFSFPSCQRSGLYNVAVHIFLANSSLLLSATLQTSCQWTEGEPYSMYAVPRSVRMATEPLWRPIKKWTGIKERSHSTMFSSNKKKSFTIRILDRWDQVMRHKIKAGNDVLSKPTMNRDMAMDNPTLSLRCKWCHMIQMGHVTPVATIPQ